MSTIKDGIKLGIQFDSKIVKREPDAVVEQLGKEFQVVANKLWHADGSYTQTVLAKVSDFSDAAIIQHSYNLRLETK